MKIRSATDKEIGTIATIVSQSYQTVAKAIHLNQENCPKHPSNCTPEWVQKDFERGVAYFLLETQGRLPGCAALEKADARICYLERLAVLPGYRRLGHGRKLVDHVIAIAGTHGYEKMGIGIIAKQTVLKKWYQKIGFVETGTKTFAHLPFEVAFLEYYLSQI